MYTPPVLMVRAFVLLVWYNDDFVSFSKVDHSNICFPAANDAIQKLQEEELQYTKSSIHANKQVLEDALMTLNEVKYYMHTGLQERLDALENRTQQRLDALENRTQQMLDAMENRLSGEFLIEFHSQRYKYAWIQFWRLRHECVEMRICQGKGYWPYPLTYWA